jgi:hypothetical protein
VNICTICTRYIPEVLAEYADRLVVFLLFKFEVCASNITKSEATSSPEGESITSFNNTVGISGRLL